MAVYREYSAPKELQGLIKKLWFFYQPRAYDVEHSMLPDVSSDVVFTTVKFLGVPFQEPLTIFESNLVMVGPVTEIKTVRCSGPQLSVGLRLQPWAAGYIVDSSMADLTNRAQSLIGSRFFSRENLEELNRCQSVDDLMTALIRQLWSASRNLPAAMQQIARVWPQLAKPVVDDFPRVSDLAALASLSERQLRRHFERYVGVPPLMAQRILRFQKVIGNVASRQAGKWAEAAVQAGYYDQAHMNREFNEFAKASPQKLLS